MVVRSLGFGVVLALSLAACSDDDATGSRGRNSESAAGTSGEGNGGGAGTSGGSSAGSGVKGGSDSGGSSAGHVSVGPDTPLEDVTSIYAAAICRTYGRCFTLLVDATNGQEGCVRLLERVAEDGVFGRIVEAVEQGRLSYQPDVFPSCIEAIDATSCAGVDDLICPGLFLGTKQSGESCELDEECAGDAQCLVEASCPGTCGPRRALGEACSDQNHCAAGLRCATQEDATNECVEPAQLGENCGTFLPCAGLLYCKGAEVGSLEPTGTCVERSLPHDGEEGAACDGLGSDRLCGPGLVCTFVQEGGESVGRCQPVAETDGPCAYSIPDACPAGQYCHIETAVGVKPATGTCTNRPALGQTCRYNTIHAAPCSDPDHVCSTEQEICVPIKRLGEECTSGGECASSDCSSGKCVALLECEQAAAEAL